MTKTTPDFDKLDQLLALMRIVDPGRIDMKSFSDVDFSPHDCGTTACIAGWATTIFPELVFDHDRCIRLAEGGPDDSFESLAEFFGLTGRQVADICGSNIPNHEAVINLAEHIAVWKKQHGG